MFRFLPCLISSYFQPHTRSPGWVNVCKAVLVFDLAQPVWSIRLAHTKLSQFKCHEIVLLPCSKPHPVIIFPFFLWLHKEHDAITFMSPRGKLYIPLPPKTREVNQGGSSAEQYPRAGIFTHLLLLNPVDTVMWQLRLYNVGRNCHCNHFLWCTVCCFLWNAWYFKWRGVTVNGWQYKNKKKFHV